jgi:3D-(3,5/4)-trihydroxycyclohexane-1,2-dione acylhydrolase (decyclizing)
VIYVQNDRLAEVPSYESWWDVPVAEVSQGMPGVAQARVAWEGNRASERDFL